MQTGACCLELGRGNDHRKRHKREHPQASSPRGNGHRAKMQLEHCGRESSTLPSNLGCAKPGLCSNWRWRAGHWLTAPLTVLTRLTFSQDCHFSHHKYEPNPAAQPQGSPRNAPVREHLKLLGRRPCFRLLLRHSTSIPIQNPATLHSEVLPAAPSPYSSCLLGWLGTQG